MDISAMMERLTTGQSLSEEAAGEAISAVMSGELSPVRIAALLTALHCKGETVEEIVGAAKAMRAHAAQIPTRQTGILDTCGTGGDRHGSFNISTVTALAVSAAGVPVAKHGNRSATSRCGSIDLLEHLGINVMMSPKQATHCLDTIGLTVLFARVVHPAMKFAAPIRGELGFRTVFNYLGPLTNPAKPEYQLVGISDAHFLETYASCLSKLGVRRAWVVSGTDGMDEITLTGPTTVLELQGTKVQRFEFSPEEAGLPRCALEDLKGGGPDENAEIALRILDGRETGPRRNAVLLNTGAALYITGKTETVRQGVSLAAEMLDSGKAKSMLERIIETSKQET